MEKLQGMARASDAKGADVMSAADRHAARGARCLKAFERAGFRLTDVPMLQPVEPFSRTVGRGYPLAPVRHQQC